MFFENLHISYIVSSTHTIPALAHQRIMITLLHNLATIDNDNAIRVSNSGKAMCEQYGCAVLQNQFNPLLDLRLGLHQVDKSK
jgi:hypothetical protein